VGGDELADEHSCKRFCVVVVGGGVSTGKDSLCVAQPWVTKSTSTSTSTSTAGRSIFRYCRSIRGTKLAE
jgi:hypothetical protein